MLRRPPDRRLATVLFLDIVDSTRIAAELGDRPWRDLVAAFRAAVRRELRRESGREQDTAGDGFFITFAQPAAAVRAAAAIVAAAQRLGLDVRCGLHAGELERIDGRAGGIAAHIGARVMALGGAADVLATSTVGELVVGGGVDFEPRVETELKGIPGRWAVLRVVAVDGRRLPGSLAPDEARARREDAGGRGRRATPGLMVAGATIALAVIALGAWQAAGVAGPSPSPSVVAPGSSDAGVGSAPPSSEPPVALVRLDPATGKIARIVPDEYVPSDAPSDLWTDGGNLWQLAAGGSTRLGMLIRRDLATGAALAQFEMPVHTFRVLTGNGSIWRARGYSTTIVERLDPISGRVLDTIEPGVALYDIAIGGGAVWALTQDNELIEIDALSGDIIDRDATGTSGVTPYVSYVDGLLWLCSCAAGTLSAFDPDRDEVVRLVQYPAPLPGGILPAAGRMWVIDREAATITPVDASTSDLGRALGLSGKPGAGVFAFGSIWISAGPFVHQVDPVRESVRSITMPDGVFAAGIAVDEATGALWLSSCDCTEQP